MLCVGLISRVTIAIAITHIKGFRTPLTTTHEPPSSPDSLDLEATTP